MGYRDVWFRCLIGTFSGMKNFTYQSKTLEKTGETVSKSKIVLKHEVSNTWRKTWLPGKPGEIYQSWETTGGTGRVDRSDEFSSLSDDGDVLQKCGFIT